MEDIVQLLDYKPVLEKNLKKRINDEEVNCNLLVSNDYSSHIRNRIAMMDEDSHHLKLVEVNCIKIKNNYFKSIKKIIIIFTIVVFVDFH